MFCNQKRRKLTLLLIFAFPVILQAQQQIGYELTGRIKGLREGARVTMNRMVYNPGRADDIPVDSAKVINGEFTIKGIVPEGPRIYWLHCYEGIIDAMSGEELSWIYIMFINNGEKITVTCSQDIYQIPHEFMNAFFNCDGSPTNNLLTRVVNIEQMFAGSRGAINAQLNKIRDSIGYERTSISVLMKAKKDIEEAVYYRFLYRLEPDFVDAVPLLAFYLSDYHNSYWKEAYNNMDDRLKNSVYGKMLKKRISTLEGQQMPPFVLQDPEEKNISLNEALPKAKITLVRFWATNSVERKKFDRELRSLYKIYHDKGLNIIAVSTDSYKDQWKQTLSAEKYPWTNVIDLKGQRVVDTVYHELGRVDHQNTTNVLVDAKGRIIAWDVYGIDLEYYLDKYLNGPEGNADKKTF